MSKQDNLFRDYCKAENSSDEETNNELQSRLYADIYHNLELAEEKIEQSTSQHGMESLVNQLEKTEFSKCTKTEHCESLQQHETILISDSESDTKYNIVPKNVKQKRILARHLNNNFKIDSSDSEDSVIIVPLCLDSDKESRSSAIEEDDLLLGRMDNKDNVKNENSDIPPSTRLHDIPPFEGTFRDYKEKLRNDRSKQQEISEEKWAKYFFEPMPKKLKFLYNDTRRHKNFDVYKLQACMPRDRSKWWVVNADMGYDSDDGMILEGCDYRPYYKRNYDYRDPEYRDKRCHLCGTTEHNINQCSQKICFTCGSMYSIRRSICGICCARSCNMCHSIGHYADQCPDLWRRFHQTTTQVFPKHPGNVMKPSNLLHCSYCTKRGHESSTCKEYTGERRHYVTPARVTNYTNWPQLTTNYQIPTLEGVCTTSIEQSESINLKTRRNNKRPFPRSNVNDEFTHQQKRRKNRRRKRPRKEFLSYLKPVKKEDTTISSYYY